MPIFRHDELPIREVARIKTRVLADAERGAHETAVWEQWIESDGHIPLHYHEVEEVLVFLVGEIALSLSAETTILSAPVTVVVPAREIHGLRPTGSTRVHLLAIFPTTRPRIFAPDGNLRPMPWEDFGGGDAPL